MKRIFSLLALVVVALSMMAQPKYVFYFIGDGMGINQVLAAEMYLAEQDGIIGRKQLQMTQFPVMGTASTFSASNGITDSSAAGTCLASGKKTNNGSLGVDAKGYPVQSIAEILRDNGWAIGVSTSVSIDHATPGAFYAHVGSRGDYYTIGTQLAESKFDFFAGSTFLQPFHKEKTDQPNVYALCGDAGYTFCHGYDEMQQNMKRDRVILIQENEGKDKNELGCGHLPQAIDRQPSDLTLEQITKAGIEFLSSKNRPFFLMVEGGQIDWACHSNDAATVVQEVIDFDMAIRRAFEFYAQHPDETLIVVTADHETGGMALGNSKYTLNLQALQYQTVSAGALSDQLKRLQAVYGKKLKYDQVKELFQKTLGLYDQIEVSDKEDAALRDTFKKMMKNKASDTKTLYASLNALSDKAVSLLDKKSKIGWTTHAHSAAPVPVFAIGVGAEQFTGFYDNSDIMPRILQIATSK